MRFTDDRKADTANVRDRRETLYQALSLIMGRYADPPMGTTDTTGGQGDLVEQLARLRAKAPRRLTGAS